MEGFTNKSSKFWQFRDNLTINKNLIMYGIRFFIPKILRKEMLNKLHEGHLGIVKCRRRAKEAVW